MTGVPPAPSWTSMPADHARTLLDRLRGGLIVSCQAPPGDPLRDPAHMAAMAASVASTAGVVGIRAQGVDDVRAVRAAVSELPVIGLWKDGAKGVYITPTAEHARAIARAGADVVAVDATSRSRPDGRPLRETVEAVHRASRLLMADVSTVDEGDAAAALGADLVSTTLSGYTAYSRQRDGPDLDLVAELAGRVEVPVVAEGRVGTPAQSRAALDAGAWSVVVGTAITAPAAIAGRFTDALR
ncbi:N-acetylmannosamine-6-phosphate 2-epimerase [Streptomyces oceani]|uniref:Putative N-acetylmannosamine-6-phosphate 2-epimerase n=1 Tax=Streptomyces oceani TaxID=1075402 RepID=A0A1E7KII3_9ACTN|nr:putative N-acetylmannosamine-6-phosphate 2-epimerase [Streptomyces oceani]OEV03701.1 N-acetylmannosamine-6-phosphate 2-epimerase [Streptomyces oceani]